MRNHGNTCIKEEDRLFASSKLSLFARFELGSILRKLDEIRYLLAAAQMIGNGQQFFAILPGTLFSLIADDDGDYDFNDDDDNFDKRNYDDFCNSPWFTLLLDC